MVTRFKDRNPGFPTQGALYDPGTAEFADFSLRARLEKPRFGNTSCYIDLSTKTIQYSKVRYKKITAPFFAALLWAWTGAPMAASTGTTSPGLAQVDRYSASMAQASELFGRQGPTTITIDIIPGSAENIVRAGAKRVIPVAILGSPDLDVVAINPRTIRLNGIDIMLVGKSDKSLCHQADINQDSYRDLVCDVRTTGYKVIEGEYRIIIKAGTYNGESLTGEDRIKIVGN